MDELPPGLREGLADRYTIERELGRGGMATVYLATDLRHERPVALKVLHPQLAASLGPDRFLREIKLAARLQHPHILTAGRSHLTMASFASLRMTTVWAAAALAVLPAPGGHSPAAIRDEEGVAEVIAKFKEKDPGLADVFASAAGYAVYPTIGKGGIGLGGARGKGWVYQAGKVIGRSTMNQVTIGFQFGGQVYSEVVFFKTKAALDNFKLGHLKLDAQASAVALTARASADLAYRNGVAIVTMAKGGLMYEASVGGQKFSFTPVGK